MTQCQAWCTAPQFLLSAVVCTNSFQESTLPLRQSPLATRYTYFAPPMHVVSQLIPFICLYPPAAQLILFHMHVPSCSSVLPLPFAFARMGVLPGVVTALVVAYANTLTSTLLLRAAARTGCYSYEGIAEAIGGRGCKVGQFVFSLATQGEISLRALHAVAGGCADWLRTRAQVRLWWGVLASQAALLSLLPLLGMNRFRRTLSDDHALPPPLPQGWKGSAPWALLGTAAGTVQVASQMAPMLCWLTLLERPFKQKCLAHCRSCALIPRLDRRRFLGAPWYSGWHDAGRVADGDYALLADAS